MEHPQFLKCLENISTLTHEQLSLLSAALNDRSHPGAPKSAVMSRIEHNFSSHPACPHCHSKSIKRWGHQNGRQRYCCGQCRRTFNAFTGTALSHLRVVGMLNRYVGCMMSSMTLRPAAHTGGIALDTSFRLHHRLMEIIESDKAEHLQGIVEMDETLFRESCKGQQQPSRAARKRGGRKSHQRTARSDQTDTGLGCL